MATYIDALMVGFGLDPKEYIEGVVTVGKQTAKIKAATKKDYQELEREVRKDLKTVEDAEKKAAKEAEAAHKRMVAAHEKTSQSLDTLIRNFLKLAALFTAGAGISSFVGQITAADSALGRLAGSLGEAPADISAIANAVERGGGSADAAAASFKRLSQGIQEIKVKGDGALRQPLLEIQAAGGKGLDLTKSQVEIWSDIADNMKAINDKRGAAQATFFGEQAGFDEGTINLLRQGGAAFRKAMADSKAFGTATKEDTDAAQKLQTALIGLKQQSESFGRTIVTLVSPAVTDLLKQLQDWLVTNKDLIQTKIKEFVDGLAEALKGIDWPGVITGLRDFFKGVNDAAQAVGGWKVVAEAFFALWVGSKFLNVLTALGSLRLAFLGLAGLGPLGWGAAGLAALGIGLATADKSKALVHGGVPGRSMNPGDELPGVDSSENRRPGIFARARRAIAKRLGRGGGAEGGAGSGSGEGSRSFRNNNPGNIKFGDFARRMGATGADDKGFAVFPSYETGRKAQSSLLFDSNAYKNLSIQDAIARWAPGSDGNDPAGYAAQMAKAAGVGVGTRLSDLTTDQRERFLDAQQRKEGWIPGARKVAGDDPAPAGTPRLRTGLATVRASNGRTFQVAAEYAANFQGFIDDYEKAGGVVGPNSGGNNERMGNASYHPLGRAIDVNQVGRGVRAGGRTLPLDVEDKLAEKWGLRSGNSFRSNDNGHFEVHRAEAARAAIERLKGDQKPTSSQSPVAAPPPTSTAPASRPTTDAPPSPPASFAPTLSGIQAFRESSMWRGIGNGAGGTSLPDTGRMLADAQAARFAAHNNSTSTTTNTTTLNGGIHLTTQATDADGIARDMEGALKRRNFAQSANYGAA